GAQLLVGLRERGNEGGNQLASRVVTAAGPWASLGFGAAPSGGNFPIVNEPLLEGVLPPANTAGGRAVALAAQFLGVPYRWGGACEPLRRRGPALFVNRSVLPAAALLPLHLLHRPPLLAVDGLGQCALLAGSLEVGASL